MVVAGLLGSSDVNQHKVLGDSKLEAIPFSYRCSFEKNTAPQFKAVRLRIRPRAPVQNSVSLKLMQRKTLNFVINDLLS